MGILDAVMGNASSVDAEDVVQELERVLTPGEKIECAFRVVRDKWVFTDKRLIMINVQGLTGKKKEYLTIPYKSIVRFSVETSGVLDLESEMKIWVRSMQEPYTKDFGRSVDVCGIQQLLAYHVLSD